MKKKLIFFFPNFNVFFYELKFLYKYIKKTIINQKKYVILLQKNEKVLKEI